MDKTTYASLSQEYKELVDEAERVMALGYAPYSRFYVGAALLTKPGNVYSGANIETASYVAVCAERAAVGAAISHGEYEFKAIAVISKSDFFDVTQISGPCGICRQLLFEFSQVANYDLEIINCSTQKDSIAIGKISDLLPLSWGPQDTATDISKYQSKFNRL